MLYFYMMKNLEDLFENFKNSSSRLGCNYPNEMFEYETAKRTLKCITLFNEILINCNKRINQY